MTWVLGWPFYDDDAIEIAKKHNLVKDPNASQKKYIDAARSWVLDRVGIIEALGCWAGNMPEFVLAAYVEYGNKRYPPTEAEIDRNYLMSKKQYQRLKSLMPLRDLAWYQHDDPSCTLYSETVWVYDDDEEEEGGDHEEMVDGIEGGGEGEERCDEVVDDDGASDWEDEDAGDSDAETVTTNRKKRSSA